MASKLARKQPEKVSRINDLFKSTGSPFIDTAEINPDEIKLDVIRDPKRKARLKIEQEKADLRVKEQELIALACMKKAIAERYQEAQKTIKTESEDIELYTQALNNARDQQQASYVEHYQEALKRHRRWLASA